MKKTLQTMIIGLSALAVITILQTVPAHAASLTVATGNDENTDNASCSLSEAIENINDQAPTNTDCPAGDGANDTINIPAGTITLVGNLVTLTEPTTVKGSGVGLSIIDGDNQYLNLSSGIADNENFNVSDISTTGLSGFALCNYSGRMTVERVDISGVGATRNVIAGGAVTVAGILSSKLSASGTNLDTTVKDSVIHDIISASNSGSGVYGIAFAANGGINTNFTIERTTVSNIEATTANAYGVGYIAGFFGNAPSNNATGSIENLTMNNVKSASTGIAGGVVSNSVAGTGTARTVIDLKNSTISEVSGGMFTTLEGAGLLLGGGTYDNTGVADATLNATNVLMTDNKTTVSGPKNCGAFDTSFFVGGSGGSITNSFISGGGNLTDDTSCSGFFNKMSDKNNIAGLNTTLGPLQNNGGLVPTIALLKGSPAIDSGVTIAGLTDDARGSVRPQGSAYDSGAYESPFTTAAAAPAAATNVASLASTGQSRITLLLVTAIMLIASLGAVVLVKRQSV